MLVTCSYTGAIGRIKEHKWYGPNGMQQLRTKKEPKQPIPTFDETIELFMRVRSPHSTPPPPHPADIPR